MTWRWLLWWRSDPPLVGNGEEARAAKARAQAKLRAARQDWPEVYRARRQFTELLEQAMRRQ